MTNWLEEAEAANHQACSALQGAGTGLDRSRTVVLEDIQRALARVGGHGARADLRLAQSVDQEEILAKVRGGRNPELRSREARYAVMLVDLLTPAELGAVLYAHPRAGRHFARACLARWHLVMTAPDGQALGNMVADHVGDLRCGRSGLLSRHSLRTLTATDVVAQALERQPPGAVADWLIAEGFELRWSFTAHVVLCWLGRLVKARESLDDAWVAVMQDERLAAAVLPHRRASAAAAAGLAQSTPDVQAQSTLIFLRAGLGAKATLSAANLDDLTAWAFASDLGDPRIPPESEGWRRIRSVDPQTYAAFFERLIQEDLEIFFKYAMKEKERNDFWLLYLKAIRRTACVLSRDKHEELQNLFAGSTDKKLRAAVGRAHRFRDRHDTHAFCIYFDRFVVVEYSITGNAAYVYERTLFEERFEKRLRANQLSGPGELKLPRLAAHRIVHNGRWQLAAQEWLNGAGIWPDWTHSEREAAAAAPSPEAPVQARDERGALVRYLREAGLHVDDRRPSGGRLWVLGGLKIDWMMRPLARKGHRFKFVEKGYSGSGGRPAWYLDE